MRWLQQCFPLPLKENYLLYIIGESETPVADQNNCFMGLLVLIYSNVCFQIVTAGAVGGSGYGGVTGMHVESLSGSPFPTPSYQWSYFRFFFHLWVFVCELFTVTVYHTEKKISSLKIYFRGVTIHVFVSSRYNCGRNILPSAVDLQR